MILALAARPNGMRKRKEKYEKKEKINEGVIKKAERMRLDDDTQNQVTMIHDTQNVTTKENKMRRVITRLP